MTLTKDTGWIKVNRPEMDEWMWDKGRTEEAPDLPKIKFLENVLLTKREYDTLVSEFGRSDTDSAIKFL